MKLKPFNNKMSRDKWRIKNINQYLDLVSPLLSKPLSECIVLDVGCGHGILSVPIAKKVKKVYGIDPSELSIQQAKKYAIKENVSNVTFKKLSIFGLSDTNEYDIVILSNSIQYVKNQKLYLKKALDALKKDGVFYLETNNKLFPCKYLFRSKKICKFLSYNELKDLLDSFHVYYNFVMLTNPRTSFYKIGKKLVETIPAGWRFANAFSVVGKK